MQKRRVRSLLGDLGGRRLAVNGLLAVRPEAECRNPAITLPILAGNGRPAGARQQPKMDRSTVNSEPNSYVCRSVFTFCFKNQSALRWGHTGTCRICHIR